MNNKSSNIIYNSINNILHIINNIDTIYKNISNHIINDLLLIETRVILIDNILLLNKITINSINMITNILNIHNLNYNKDNLNNSKIFQYNIRHYIINEFKNNLNILLKYNKNTLDKFINNNSTYIDNCYEILIFSENIKNSLSTFVSIEKEIILNNFIPI